MIKANPPIGVIAPSHRIPLRLKTYKLPEKIKIPAKNSQPATPIKVDGSLIKAIKIRPKAW